MKICKEAKQLITWFKRRYKDGGTTQATKDGHIKLLYDGRFVGKMCTKGSKDMQGSFMRQFKLSIMRNVDEVLTNKLDEEVQA